MIFHVGPRSAGTAALLAARDASTGVSILSPSEAFERAGWQITHPFEAARQTAAIPGQAVQAAKDMKDAALDEVRHAAEEAKKAVRNALIGLGLGAAMLSAIGYILLRGRPAPRVPIIIRELVQGPAKPSSLVAPRALALAEENP